MSHFNAIIKNRWHQKLELDLISWCQLKSILPSIRALVYPEIFLELDHYFFLSFCMVLETHGKLCLTELDIFGKEVFAPKIGKMGLKYAKNSFFLELLKNVVINLYWICSIMKINIIYCVLAQIPYLGKILFLRCGSKCFQPIWLQDC